MFTIFSQVSAVISVKFVSLFPNNIEFDTHLNILCKSLNVTVTLEEDQYTVEGDLKALSNLQNNLVNTVNTMYENSPGNNQVAEQIQNSGSFSALVEAAEALSRDEALCRDTALQEALNDSNSALFSLIKEHDYVAQDQTKSFGPDTVNESWQSTGSGSLQNSSSNAEDNSSQMGVPNWPKVSDGSRYCEAKPIRSLIDIALSECNANGSLNDTGSNNTDAKNGKFFCQECSYSTHVRYYLIDHIRNQHGSTQVKCTQCDKIFSNKRLLKQHLKTHENNTMACETCGKTYKSSTTFKAHLKTHEENYVKLEIDCDTCKKSFSSQYSYDMHKNAEHLGVSKTFLCQVCGNSFASKYTLSQHMNLHTGQKPYKCNECGKCFSSNSVLRDHKNIHKPKRLFPCNHPGCGKVFNQRTNLKSHAAVHTGTRAFVCEECNRSFTQKQALQRHERSHKGVKPFKCRLCENTFGDHSVIRRHLKHVHKLDKDVETWREDIIELKIEEESETTITKVSKEGEATKSHSSIPTVVNAYNDKKKSPAPLVVGATENTKVNIHDGQQMITIPVYINDSKNMNKQVNFCFPAFQNPATEVQYQGTVPNFETAFMLKPAQNHMLPVARQELTDIHPMPQIQAPEREHVQFFNENLDGTFTSIDEVMPKVKSSEDVYMKLVSSEKLSTETSVSEQLKPDGTLAENNLALHNENVTRFGENEVLSESLTQFYLPPYYAPYGAPLSGQMPLTPLPGQETDGTKQ